MRLSVCLRHSWSDERCITWVILLENYYKYTSCHLSVKCIIFEAMQKKRPKYRFYVKIYNGLHTVPLTLNFESVHLFFSENCNPKNKIWTHLLICLGIAHACSKIWGTNTNIILKIWYSIFSLHLTSLNDFKHYKYLFKKVIDSR